MMAKADAFLVLPGGLGTLDELFEVWTTPTLGLHAKPIVLLDPDGFYAGLLDWLASLVPAKFVRSEALGRADRGDHRGRRDRCRLSAALS